MKAARNLDASCDQGTTDSTINSLLHFIKEDVIYNLESIGINPGNGESEVCKEVDRIKSWENDRCVEQFTKDEVSRIFDQEEKELAEEEEVDKLILNSRCSEIMDQVMDLDSAYPLDCKTIPRKKSPWRSQKGKRSDKGNNHSIAK
jgi:hypothetical protein